jgi:hypothetical protein
MQSYKEHPLLHVLANMQRRSVSDCDQQLGDELDASLRMRRRIGSIIYPIKNRIERFLSERRLRRLGVAREEYAAANVICYGQKGFGSDVFLTQIARILGKLESVVCFGCGLGAEVALVARILKPRKVIGYDYFSYSQAWAEVKRRVESELRVAVEFECLDLRHQVLGRRTKGDLVISFAVLEHLRDMDSCFEQIKGMIRNEGWFASQWGPMWYSFSGDHFSSESGFEMGYQHLLLSPAEYLEYYNTHPHNIADSRACGATWLELGLQNFARYDEYLAAIKKWFGPVTFLKWQLSAEAFRWANRYPNKFRHILEKHPHLKPLDLVLGGAAAVSRN